MYTEGALCLPCGWNLTHWCCSVSFTRFARRWCVTGGEREHSFGPPDHLPSSPVHTDLQSSITASLDEELGAHVSLISTKHVRLSYSSLACSHRDVKPNNCLIATNGVLKLADFGLSRTLASPERDRPYTNQVRRVCVSFLVHTNRPC